MIHVRYEGGPHDGKTEEIDKLTARRCFAPPLQPPDFGKIGPHDPADLVAVIQYFYAGSDPKHKTGHLYKYYDAEAH